MAMPQPPRISFSGDFWSVEDVDVKETTDKAEPANFDPDFEFTPTDHQNFDTTMLPADELFFQGRLMPFWPSTGQKLTAGIHVAPLCASAIVEAKNMKVDVHECSDREKIKRGTSTDHAISPNMIKLGSGSSLSWLVDEDPSPRPPKCTVLWKELLKLKKQQSSEEAEKEGKRKKKGLERARSASVRIRPFVKVPLCNAAHVKNINVLPR